MRTPNPYADTAESLRRVGLVPIPTGGEDGKAPLVKWPKRPYGQKALSSLTAKHPNANIGVLCGLSGVTIVDIDDPVLLPAMLERFGDTPLQTQTPSGGVHLWYRSNGEGNAQRLDGLAVDIRGEGGFVVVPPSVRPSGAYGGRAYLFLKGGWNDLDQLPDLKPESLAPRLRRGVIAQQGTRNSTLFAALLRAARACDDWESLVDVAQTLNADAIPPLDEAEVLKTAISAWGYEQRGENWSGTGARVNVTDKEYDLLKECSDALNLLIKLRFAHGARSEPFAISAKAMNRAQVIKGWGAARYRHARDVLLDHGFLACTFVGGQNKHAPSLYALRTPHALNGTAPSVPMADKAPQREETPRGSETKHLARGVDPEHNITKHSSSLQGEPIAGMQVDLFTALGLGHEPEKQSFGSMVKQARRQQGLTQQQVAERVRLSRSCYGNIETETYRPSPETAKALRMVLGLGQFCNGQMDTNAYAESRLQG